jgi:hypothetical protein
MKNNLKISGNKNRVKNTQVINGVPPVAKINEAERNPLTILGKQAKTSWLLIGAIVGL